MTQKYKKNNSPAIQNGIFSSFPDVLQPNLSGFPGVFLPNLSDFPDVSQPNFPGFPGVLQPNLSGFPDVLQPDSPSFPDVFWIRFKELYQNLKIPCLIKILFLCGIWFTFAKHICESARFAKVPPLPLCTYILLRKRFASIFLKQKSPNF